MLGPPLVRLLHAHAWPGFLATFASLDGHLDDAWTWDDTGALRVGTQEFVGVEICGSWTAISSTWRWADANQTVAAEWSAAAGHVRARLADEGIPEGRTDAFPCDAPDAWLLALGVADLLGHGGAFRGVHEHGEAHLLLARTPPPPSLSSAVLATAVARFCGEVPAPHLPWFQAHARVGDPVGSLVLRQGRSSAVLTSDELGRMIRVRGLGP